LNINYINDNDLYRQTSNPIENEFDKYNYKLDENHNSSSALDIISTDIYESNCIYLFLSKLIKI